MNIPAADALEKASDQLSEHASQLEDMAHDARYRTEDFIQTNPWIAVSIAVGVGCAFGIALGLGLARR